MFKKKTYGVKPKMRTRAEIDHEYSTHCVQAGHKLGMIAQLQGEIDQHTTQMIALRTESSKLPPEPAQVAKTEETTPAVA